MLSAIQANSCKPGFFLAGKKKIWKSTKKKEKKYAWKKKRKKAIGKKKRQKRRFEKAKKMQEKGHFRICFFIDFHCVLDVGCSSVVLKHGLWLSYLPLPGDMAFLGRSSCRSRRCTCLWAWSRFRWECHPTLGACRWKSMPRIVTRRLGTWTLARFGETLHFWLLHPGRWWRWLETWGDPLVWKGGSSQIVFFFFFSFFS